MWDEKDIIEIAKQVLGYLGFKPSIVESLPETGGPNVLYLVPKDDPELGDIYEEFLWLNNAYESVGTTGVDLSNYVDITSEQTISGVKTFSNGIKADAIKSSSDGNNIFVLASGAGIYAYRKYLPSRFYGADNADLGSSAFKIRDIHMDGVITNDTDSVSVAGLAALIAYAKAQGWIS